MAVYTLDVKDRKILAELDVDARRPNSEIGKKVGLSKEAVKYRIDRLLEAGVILRFYTLTNYFKLGIFKYKLYLRFTNANKEKIDEIAQYFYAHKTSEWVVTTTGRWDMIVGFLVHNVNEFDDEIQAFMNKFSECVQEKAVSTTLHLVHLSRGFLKSKTEQPNIIYHTAHDKREEIDETDEQIIKLITNNARMPITEIASKLKITPRIAQYRLKTLEKKQIILAYKAHLDPKVIGRIFCKAIIYMSNTTEKRVNSFMSYVAALPGAVWPQRVMGSWDFELDFELESYDEFQDIILDLKEKFPDIIKNHEFCIVSREFKLDFFPGCEREESFKEKVYKQRHVRLKCQISTHAKNGGLQGKMHN